MSPKTSNARDAILLAAQELFAANGVAATTPRQVIEHSGVGQGSLYHHFPSKTELAVATLKRTTEVAIESAQATLDSPHPPRDRVVEYLRRDRDAIAGCRVGRLTADPVVMSTNSLLSSVSGYFSQLLEHMTRAFVEDGLSARDATDRATTAIAVIQGGYVLSRALGDAKHMRHAVDGLIALMDADRSSTPSTGSGGVHHDR